MDIIFAILALLCVLIGVLGSFVPILPGPPVSFLGMLFALWSGYAPFPNETLLLWGCVTVGVTLVDYFLPAWFARRFGGSRKAMWGATIGLIVGMILPFRLIGIIVGPFVGAYIGEMIHDGRDRGHALKVAFGSFMAFICGTGMKLAVTIWMGVLVVKGIFF